MSSFISTLVRFRWYYFLASIAVLVFSVAGLRHFAFDGSPRVFFSGNDPSYERFQALEDTYGNDFKVFFMLSARDGSILEPRHLASLKEMTERAWTLPYVRRVDSLSNFQYTHSEHDELYVDDFFSEEVLNDPDKLAARQAIALKDIDIVKRLVTADGKHAAIVLSLSLSYDQTMTPEAGDLVEKAYALADDIKAGNPDLETSATGSLLSTYHNMQVAEADMGLMIPVMFGLMFLILGLLLRSLSTVFVSFILAVFTAMGAMGLASWFGITFSILSVNAVMISIIVTMAHCIHIFTQLFKELQTKSKAEALAASLRVNFFAVSVTSLTTVIGFLSLNTNDLPPAVALGNTAAIGTALAWLFSLTLLPALVLLLPFKPHKTSELLIDRVMDKLADLLIARRYLVLLVMIAMSALMIDLSFRNDFNDRLTETLHKPHLFRDDTDRIDQHFGAIYIDSFNLDSGSEYNIVDPEYLKNVDRFATFLRQQPEISSVRAFSDVIKRLNQSMHNDDPAFYRIPDDRELIAQYLLMYEMSLPFGLDLGEQLTPDRRRSLVTANMPSLDTATDIDVDQRIWAWQQENLPPEMQDRNRALSTIWSYLTIHSLSNSLEGSAIALLLISVVMLFMLRSVRYGLISLIPNILPAAFGFGIWFLFSGEIVLGLTCVVIITIGIVVDDTVHFLVKYQKALKEHKGDAEKAVRTTLKQVGSALFMTTAVLSSGFFVLALSKIVINSALGQVTTVILLAAYILDILLLPTLLLIIDRNRKAEYQQKQALNPDYEDGQRQPELSRDNNGVTV